jgi:hypothetical protein
MERSENKTRKKRKLQSEKGLSEILGQCVKETKKNIKVGLLVFQV